ncbi:hypothetical protein KAI87_03630, partial [Myxococcota bacterium]|nr:hypothetical protein [Myxococcota bacterium]
DPDPDPDPTTDCLGCLGSSANCEEACHDEMGGTGHCGWPESTDWYVCCICYPENTDPDPPSCSAVPALNTIQDTSAKLPISHRLELAGSSVKVELGVSGGFSGIGASLRLARNSGAWSDNLIESRSGAGAAHQFTMFGEVDGIVYVQNQAAGNSCGSQWGYEACPWMRDSDQTFDGQAWLPMSTDEIRPGSCTSPLLSGDQQSRDVLVGRGIFEMKEFDAGAAGTVVEVRKTWKVKNGTTSTVTLDEEISWDAYYVRTQFSRDHQMRTVYAWEHSNGAKTYDAIIPHEPFGEAPGGVLLPNRIENGPAGAYVYEYNPNFEGWWVIHTGANTNGKLDHLVYAFEYDGELMGVAIAPPSTGRSTFGYETRVYPETSGEDEGSLTLFLVFESGVHLSLAPNEERSYAVSYYIGTLAQLEAIGMGVGNVDLTATVENCSGCLGSYLNCYEACDAAMGGTGHCGAPGSTDPASCCVCY